jgi:hypothetical protein
VVTDRLTPEGHHGAKFIGFGPDGLLYVATGVPCNVCEPDAAHGIIQRMKPDGSQPEVVARGVRNSVGFDWSPLDKTLWFSDNGRDMLGDDVPSDELNRVKTVGQHFGFPYCHQGDVPDPQFGAQHRCDEFAAPAAKLGAHVAALGLRFYTGSSFPAAYRNNVLVAEHGSWNRSKKSGYRVMRIVLDAQGGVLRQEPFVEGFLQVDASGRETVLGRPADVLVLPDGSVLVSDDMGGAIYRVFGMSLERPWAWGLRVERQHWVLGKRPFSNVDCATKAAKQAATPIDCSRTHAAIRGHQVANERWYLLCLRGNRLLSLNDALPHDCIRRPHVAVEPVLARHGERSPRHSESISIVHPRTREDVSINPSIDK